MKTSKTSQSGQSGFIMMEIMLGLIVMGLVLAMALNMTMEGEDQAAGRTKAEGLSSFSQLASQYFIANRTAINSAMTDGTDKSEYCVININEDGTGGTVAQSDTKHTCAFDATLLRAKGVWPAGMSTDVMGGRHVAIARQIYDTATPPVATGGVDLLIVLASPTGALTPVKTDTRKTTELISSMTTLGGTGGIVPVGAMGSCKTQRSSSTYEICGNGWKVNLSDFIDPTEVTKFGAALPN